MADAASFLDPENWAGGYYELAMIFPPLDEHSDQRLRAATAALWDDPALDGCYLDRWAEPDDQLRVDPVLDPVEHPASLSGRVTLPSGRTAVCSSVVVRTEAYEDVQAEDWLYFALPLGSLGRVDDRIGAYPFEGGVDSRLWREPIDDWLITVGQRIYRHVPFELGIIAFEVAGDDSFTGEAADHDGVTFLAPAPTGLRVLKPRTWT